MIDKDLTLLYGVETKRLNEQVKRNIERFPEDFMFQLPYAFTENGIASPRHLIRKTSRRIVLIDNYIDDTVLTILSKRADEVECIVYTGKISKQLQLDIDKHNAQYSPIKVRTFSKAHDRFLIIDNDAYLIGASVKDLGKKWFG